MFSDTLLQLPTPQTALTKIRITKVCSQSKGKNQFFKLFLFYESLRKLELKGFLWLLDFKNNILEEVKFKLNLIFDAY